MDGRWNRFLEWSMTVIIIIFLWLGLIYYITSIIIIIFCPYSAVIFVSYCAWIYYDRRAGSLGNRKSKRWQNRFWWKHFRNYFPAKLIKTAELPANKNYMLACHHHGLVPLSVICNFATEANHVDELFPGIDFRIVNKGLVHSPLLREAVLKMGFVDASEFSLTRLLERNISTGIVVFPGAQDECALNATKNEKFEIYASRKGFIKVALKTGASLVPVLVFGDTELLKKKLTCIPSCFNFCDGCRKIDQLYPHNFYLCQLMPKRIPLNTIVGAPIDVPKVDNPPSDLIDFYHKIFYEEFKILFENYKKDYSPVGSSYEFTFI